MTWITTSEGCMLIEDCLYEKDLFRRETNGDMDMIELNISRLQGDKCDPPHPIVDCGNSHR